MNKQWKPIGSETIEWKNPHELNQMSNTERNEMRLTYKAALPHEIAEFNLELPQILERQISELLVILARFDGIQSTKEYSFPRMLLRCEAMASSQIENLTSNIKDIALAQIGGKTSQDARHIIGNIEAIKEALELPGEFSVDNILKIHQTLMEPTNVDFGGKIREQPVWIGGIGSTPDTALFVPPQSKRLPKCLSDLIKYAKRYDINPIVKTAVMHGQFETIHPFIDGNGRTGRALIHKSLRHEEILLSVIVPISLGFLHDIKGYMGALKSYQEGNPIPLIQEFVNALELAVLISHIVSEKVEKVLTSWKDNSPESKNSAMWNLYPLLVEQPVINVKLVSERLKISTRAANYLMERAVQQGILVDIGRYGRYNYFEARELVKIFEQVSDQHKFQSLFQD